MNCIDIRSDTVTVPTENMRKSMLTAEVGDDVFGTDPTVIELEQLAAQIVGKEASVFVPTGTMANQLALLVHANGQKGKEIILGQWQHIAWDENASHSVIGGHQLRTLPQNEDGEMDSKEIEKTIRKVKSNLYPETSVICLENTYHGKAVSLEYMKNVQDLGKKYNLTVHLDGARLFNAAQALANGDVKQLTNLVDTLQFCLSKGLCCPIGSILAGSQEFCQRAKQFRKLLGGTMRQVGVIAAPGIIALKEQIKELEVDHKMAKQLYEKLNEIDNQLLITEEYNEKSTSMVYFQFVKKEWNIEKSQQFVDYMLKQGNIKLNVAWEPEYKYRIVVHFYVREKQIQAIVDTVKSFLKTVYN